MIKSSFRKICYINFIFVTLLAISSGFFTYSLVSVHFLNGNLFRSSLTKSESVVFIFTFGLLTIFIIRLLIAHYVNITIDTFNQEIIFAHIFFAFKKRYFFSDFDYYFETVEYSIGDTSKAIYLIKNGKRERAIRGYYYSNTSEMKDALKGIPDYGFKKLSRLKVILLYFSRKL